jgi:hypothetical protein
VNKYLARSLLEKLQLLCFVAVHGRLSRFRPNQSNSVRSNSHGRFLDKISTSPNGIPGGYRWKSSGISEFRNPLHNSSLVSDKSSRNPSKRDLDSVTTLQCCRVGRYSTNHGGIGLAGGHQTTSVVQYDSLERHSQPSVIQELADAHDG